MNLFESNEFSPDVAIDGNGLRVPSARTRQKTNPHEFYTSDNLREVARYGGYSIYSPPGLYDGFAKDALKLYNPELFESLKGFTRRGGGLEGMYTSLKNYDKPKATFDSLNKSQQSDLLQAFKVTRKAFKLPNKFDILKLEEANSLLRKDTAAGITFPGKQKGQVLPQIYEHAKFLAHRMKHCSGDVFNPKHVKFPPCLAGHRGHLSSEAGKVKTRLFWLYPAEMLNIEGQFAPALIEAYAASPDNPMLTGKSAQRLYTEWLVKRHEGEILHGLDMQGFDQSPMALLIHEAFDILAQNINWNDRDGIAYTNKQKLRHKKLWSGIKWYFINTTILMPDGRLFRKYCGVPSGSWFTQLIDSVVNHMVTSYLCIRQHVHPIGLRVLGDDSGFRSTTRLDLEIAQQDAHPLNFILSIEKCEITEDPSEFKLLGTRYREGRQVRTDEEWFKFILYPEQPPRDVAQSMSRFVGLWLCGAMWCPAFCKFFEFFQSCYEMPKQGTFSKDQRKWMSIIYGGKAPLGWDSSNRLFWRSIFYTLT